MFRYRAAFAAALFAAPFGAVPAWADAPEQLYEHGPGRGSFALEYNGQAGDGDPVARPHSLELIAGITDRLALGIEIEGEVEEGRLRADEFAVGSLFGLTDAEAPVAISVLLQAGISRHGDWPQAQARLIAEHESEVWALNFNVIVRREEGEESGSALAFAATAHRRLTEGLSLGAEVSGQVARLSSFSSGFDAAQYAGPSLAFEFEPEDGPEVEIAINYLRRIDPGASHRDTLRLVLGLEF